MLSTIGRITVAKSDAAVALHDLDGALDALVVPSGREIAAQVCLERAKERLERALKRVVEAQEEWPPE